MKSRYKGIVFIVCSAFCFALMNLFVRLSGDLPVSYTHLDVYKRQV